MRYTKTRLRKPRKLKPIRSNKWRDWEAKAKLRKRKEESEADMRALDTLSPRLRAFFKASPGNVQAAVALMRNDPKQFTEDEIIRIFSAADEEALSRIRKQVQEWLKRREATASEGRPGLAVPLPPSIPRNLNSTDEGW